MADAVETMAYRMRGREDVPWHGLGTPVEEDVDVDQMLKLSGLDWTVSKRPLFAPMTVPTPGQDWDTAQLLKADGCFALVRDSDNKTLGPAGKDYIPTQNAQAFEFFRKFVAAGHMKMNVAGSLQGGKQVWVLAEIGKSFTLAGGDEVQGFLLLSSPHIWGKSLIVRFVTIRVVCMNTLVMALGTSNGGFRMPHIRAFDAEAHQEALVTLNVAGEMFAEFEVNAQKMATAKIDDEVTIRYIADVYQKELIVDAFGKSFYSSSPLTQVKALMDPKSPKISTNDFNRSAYEVISVVNRQPGADLNSSRNTLWGAYNAVSYQVDHLAGRDRDNALTSAWFGTKGTLKTRAFTRATQMAAVAA